MAFLLKAEGTNPFDLSEETMERISFSNKSANDSNARARDNYASLKVGGRIRFSGEGDVKDSTVNFAKWALVPASRPDAYQKLTGTAISAGQTTRKYELPNAFVVSYKETFSDQAGVGTFEAVLRQKKDQQEMVKVSGGYAAE